eukprot:symbB.v1.2.012974.t1/scaffold908.1/size153097/7
MAWRPFFDLQKLEILRSQVPDHPQGAGRGGLPSPIELSQKALTEYDYVLVDGKTNGNCCVAAFSQSAIAQGLRPGWKKMADNKRCGQVRKMACDWAAKNRGNKLWGGWSFQELVEMIFHAPFDKWLSRLRLADTWGDVAFLHAVACSIGVDALVVESSPGPARLLGQSLMVGDHDCNALVPVALHDHHHFWALEPRATRPMEQVVIKLSPENVLSNRGIETLEHDDDFDVLEASEEAIGCREQELQLCEALSAWRKTFKVNVRLAVKATNVLNLFGYNQAL